MASRQLTVVLAGDARQAKKAFDETEDRGSKFGSKMGEIGDRVAKGMAAGLAGLAVVVGKGVFDALDRSQMESMFEASLGVSPEYAHTLGTAAGDAYAAGFGGSLDEAAQAAAGVNTAFGDWIADADLQPLTEQALALTDVFGVDMTEALTGAGSMLKNGLVGDGREAMDVLVSGLQGLAPTVREEVLAATNEYSKHFAALGLSGQEVMRLLGSADGVIGVDKMGDALKELTIRGSDMSTSSQAAFQAMGLSAQDMAGKLLAGGATARGALDDIVGGLVGIKDPTTQANAAIALFGAPLEDLGTDQIPKFLAGLQNVDVGLGDVSGSAQRMADKVNSGPKAVLERFRREALQRLATFAGEHVVPMLQDLGHWFQEKIPPAVEAARRQFEEIRPRLESIRDAAAGLVDRLRPVFDAVVNFVRENPTPVIAGLATVIGVLLVGALWSMAAAMVAAFAPVYLAIAAVGLLAGGLVLAYEKVGWFHTAVDAVGRFLRDTAWPILKKVGDFIGDVLVTNVRLAAGIFRDHFLPPIRKVVDVIRDDVVPWVKTLVDRMIEIPGKLRDGFTTLKDIIVAPFKAAFNLVVDAWNATIGGEGFSTPSWVPGIGGKSFTIPELHHFASGTDFAPGGWAVLGEQGPELAFLPRGTGVATAAETNALMRRGGNTEPGVVQHISYQMSEHVDTEELARANAWHARVAMLAAR